MAAAGLVAISLFAACSSGGDDDSDTSTAPVATEPTETTEAPEETVVDDTTPEETTATTEVVDDEFVDQSLTGDAPGVTDETIKIGITYVDTEALKAVGLNYDLGQHVDVYNALIADINANGGINGRQLEAVLTPINPSVAASAEESCLKLTEDDDVFLITGFFLGEAVTCPLEAHGTAVVGGSITPALSPRAAAPWAAWLASSKQQATITQEFYDRGLLDGNVAVYMAAADQPDYDDIVKPLLDELGVEPVAVGINDAPTDDATAVEAQAKVIAESFKAADADTVLLIGIGSGPGWLFAMDDDTSYRPQLLFTVTNSPRAFYTSADATDTSILEGALVGGSYGPDQARFETESMQACATILQAAGLETPAPQDFDPNDRANQPYQALFQACPDILLTKAILERAGENLNYGTFAAAIDGLTVTIPGDPGERTYGPAPDSGDSSAYIFKWDEATKNVVIDE